MNDRETRCYSGEVRAEQRTDEPTRILGYGSVFNSRSEPSGDSVKSSSPEPLTMC